MKYDLSKFFAAVDAEKERQERSEEMATFGDLFEEVRQQKAQEAERLRDLIARGNITREEVRGVLSDLSQAGYTKFVKDVFFEYGVKRLSELSPRSYANILQLVITTFYDDSVSEQTPLVDEPQYYDEEYDEEEYNTEPSQAGHEAYYAKCRAAASDKPTSRAFLKKFDLTPADASRLGLGIDLHADTCNAPGLVPEEEKKRICTCSRLIVPVTSEFFVGIASQPILVKGKKDGSGGPSDLTVVVSRGSKQSLYCPNAFDEAFEAGAPCAFVTDDIRDAILLRKLGYYAMSLIVLNGNNGSLRALEEKIRQGIEVPVALVIDLEIQGSEDRMNDLKEKMVGKGIDAEVFYLYNVKPPYKTEEDRTKNGLSKLEWMASYAYGYWNYVCENQTPSENLATNSDEETTKPTDEHNIQTLVVQWVDKNLPREIARLFYAVPNGVSWEDEAEGRRKGQLLNEEGRRRGVLDINFDYPRGSYHGMRLEMKSPNGETTLEQRRYIHSFEEQGYYVRVCYNADEAIQAIQEYLAFGEFSSLPEVAAPQLHPMEDNSTASDLPTINSPVVSVDW